MSTPSKNIYDTLPGLLVVNAHNSNRMDKQMVNLFQTANAFIKRNLLALAKLRNARGFPILIAF